MSWNFDQLKQLFKAIAPLGWRVTASMDVASKNLDNNDRYSYEGQSEDMHTWFFLYDEKLVSKSELEPMKQVNNDQKPCIASSWSFSDAEQGSLFQHLSS